MPQLVYHTFYGEFSGDSAAEIVQQLFEDSRRGIGPELTKEQWWNYQRTVWWHKEGKKLPATHDKRGADERLLRVLVEVEALIEGPKPPSPPKDG